MLQVAWLRVDTQTILTISSHVITKNHRIAVTHIGHRTWALHIKDTRQTDSGWYMCQVNTDPMSSIVGFLEVVGKDQTLLILFQKNHHCSISILKNYALIIFVENITTLSERTSIAI